MHIYPKLDKDEARRTLAAHESTMARGESIVPFYDGGHHPKADFSTGAGDRVPISTLWDLRDRLTNALGGLGPPSRNFERKFDIAVGNALDEWFDHAGRSTAGKAEIWAYLALVVLPDIAVRRFPPKKDGTLSPERYLAGRRNVFYRAYLRAWILGPMLNDPDVELYEDELVGLVDRSMSADHRLARRIAQNLARLSSASANRRNVARSSMIDLQYELRVTDLASLSDDEMNLLVDTIFDARRAEFSGATAEGATQSGPTASSGELHADNATADGPAVDVSTAAAHRGIQIETMEILRDHPTNESAQYSFEG